MNLLFIILLIIALNRASNDFGSGGSVSSDIDDDWINVGISVCVDISGNSTDVASGSGGDKEFTKNTRNVIRAKDSIYNTSKDQSISPSSSCTILDDLNSLDFSSRNLIPRGGIKSPAVGSFESTRCRSPGTNTEKNGPSLLKKICPCLCFREARDNLDVGRLN